MNIHRAGFEGMGRLTRWVNVDYLRKIIMDLNPNGYLMTCGIIELESMWQLSARGFVKNILTVLVSGRN